jgi:hypothetical protein
VLSAIEVDAAGMQVVESSARYMKGPKPWTYFTVGRAVVPG